MTIIINSKIRKVKENEYLAYIPVMEIINQGNKKSYQLGDIYFKEGSYWFLLFNSHLHNFFNICLT